MNLSIRVLAGLGALTLLTACTFEGETRIRPDGSGELQTEVSFSAQERETLETQNPTGDFCNAAGAPSVVSVSEQMQDGVTTCVTVMAFRNLDELARYYEQRQGLRVNRLEIEDGILYYDIHMDTSSDSSGFSGFESIRWTLVLPAAPVSHNADHAEGARLTWTPAPDSGLVHMRAETEAGNPFRLAGVALGVLAAAALIGIVVWRAPGARRREDDLRRPAAAHAGHGTMATSARA